MPPYGAAFGSIRGATSPAQDGPVPCNAQPALKASAGAAGAVLRTNGRAFGAQDDTVQAAGMTYRQTVLSRLWRMISEPLSVYLCSAIHRMVKVIWQSIHMVAAVTGGPSCVC